jgi:phage anti-repressor protein
MSLGGERAMADLIPIVLSRIGAGDVESVDGRVLHANLGMERQYGNWIKAWIRKANLVEHRDYEVFTDYVKNPTGGRPTLDYALTVEAAKCIAMMSGGKRGDEVRAYFLAREQQAIALEREASVPSVKNPAHQMLIEAIVRLDAVEQRAIEAESRANEAQLEAARATAKADYAIERQPAFTVAEYVYVNKLQAKIPKSAYTACSAHLRRYCFEHNIPFRKIMVGGHQHWEEEYSFLESVYTEILPGWIARRYYAQETLKVVPPNEKETS